MISTLLSTTTVDADSSAVISSNITSTYDEYMFVMTDLSVSVDREDMPISFSATGTFSALNCVTTAFEAAHTEADGSGLTYQAGMDTTGSGVKIFNTSEAGNAADESVSLILHLFRPSNTTYVKHFYFTSTGSGYDERVGTYYVAGYVNSTSAITQLKMAPSSGNFDGVIQLYGIA